MLRLALFVAICIQCTVGIFDKEILEIKNFTIVQHIKSLQLCFDLEITPITTGPSTYLTDSIFWSPEDQSIYYADYLTNGTQPSIFRYDFNKGTVNAAYIEGKEKLVYLLPVLECGSIAEALVYKNNLFMSGAQHDNFLVRWDGKTPVAKVIRNVFRVEENYPSSKMDLSKQNARGEFFGGTTTDQYCSGSSNSSLYSYSIAKGIRKIHTGFQSNAGMTFYGDTIYLTDVCLQTITEVRKDLFGKCNYATKRFELLFFD